MKKLFIFASVVVLSIVSCSKHDVNEEPIIRNGIVLGANIEQPNVDSKAVLDGSLNTLWATGDVIKVNIANGDNSWNADIDFTLYSGNGSASGTFHTADEYSETDHWDNYAFFPWYYTNSAGTVVETGTNMGGDGFYFNLPDAYYNYTSGQSFVPLIANMSGSGKHPTSIDFKYVGGAVILNLNKVPGAAKSLGMTVAGKSITGWQGKISVAEAGSAQITAADGSNNSIWFNFDDSGTEDRSFKFIYPVPVINTSSDLTFTMYDKNDLKIWEKTALSQEELKLL